MIKRTLILVVTFMACCTTVMSQSVMTDEQVATYIASEITSGTSQTKIMTDLFKKGVTTDQLSRARKLLEAQRSPAATKKKVDRKRETEKHQETVKPEVTQYETVNNISLQQYTALDSLEMEGQEKAPEKKIFGHDIFNKQNLTFEPNSNMPTPANYTLGAGDQVIIDVWGASQKTFDTTISPDGDIIIDEVGPIKLAGLSVESARATIKKKLGQYYGGCSFNLSLGNIRTIQVQVVGEVVMPGSYSLGGLCTTFNALYAANGISEKGTLRNIKVYRNNKVLTTVDVYDYLINGNTRSDVRLQDKDIIVVGTYDCLVKVDGQIKRPMYYEMRKDENIKQLINFAGGYANNAYTKSIKLIRKSGTEYSIHTIEEFDMGGFSVADGDEVTVDAINARYSNMVEVRGAVMHPSQFQLGNKIQSVKELVEAADGLREDAYTKRAVMHRQKEDLTLEMISVDIKGILDGTCADIPLKKNDMLFIPSKNEMRGEWNFNVKGEVLYPGAYPFAENTSLQDVILLAGGLTDAASLAQVDVYRRIIDKTTKKDNAKIADHFSFSLDENFNIIRDTIFFLKPYDEIVIRKSPAYDAQQYVTVRGCVNFDGPYVITKRDYRLSDLVKECGGFSSIAYVNGARLTRKLTYEEKKQRDNALKTAQAKLYEESLDEDKNMDFGKADSLLAIKMGLDDSYTMAIDLPKAIANPGGPHDIVLQRGDVLSVPQFSNIVRVRGEVAFPISMNYKKEEKLSYYIKRAGGYADKAKKRGVYIVYANGSIVKADRGSSKTIQPGCEIIVPTREQTERLKTAEIISIGTGSASFAAIIISILNIIK